MYFLIQKLLRLLSTSSGSLNDLEIGQQIKKIPGWILLYYDLCDWKMGRRLWRII
jgi:hypothetical protein